MKRLVLFVSVLFLLSVAGCTLAERRDIARDAKSYIGVPTGAGPADVLIELGKDLASDPSPIGIGTYLGGLAAVVVSGWVGRKFIQKKYGKKNAVKNLTKTEEKQ